MDGILFQTSILFVPLIFSGVLHMAVVRADLLSALKIPIHRQWFGANKTWRGAVVMPMLTVVGCFLTREIEQSAASHPAVGFGQAHPLWLGLMLGAAYILSELPNSYIKRRRGIAPGKMPEEQRFWFALGDQGDSAIGCLLVYWLFFGIDWTVALTFLILGTALHLCFNVVLYWFGLRKNPL